MNMASKLLAKANLSTLKCLSDIIILIERITSPCILRVPWFYSEPTCPNQTMKPPQQLCLEPI